MYIRKRSHQLCCLSTFIRTLAIKKKILDVLANPNGGNKVCMIKPYNVIKIKMLSFLFSCKVVATNFCVSSRQWPYRPSLPCPCLTVA